jgi:hypothetical protein
LKTDYCNKVKNFPGNFKNNIAEIHLCFFVIFFSFSAYSQTTIKPEKFFSAGINLSGIGWSNSGITSTGSDVFAQTINPGYGILEGANGSQRPSIIANSGIGIFGGYIYKGKHNNYTGIEVEIQRNRACYTYQYPFSYPYKGATEKDWVDTDDYLKFSVAFTRSFRLFRNTEENHKHLYIRESFGITTFHKNFGIILHPGYTEDWTENNTGMKLKVLDVNKQSLMIGSEIGRKFSLKNNRLLDIGLVYYFPLSDTRHVEYEFYKSSVITSKNTITYSGSTIMLNARYTLLYKMKEKVIDSTEMIPFDDLAVDSTQIKHHDKIYHHHKINGRKFNVQESLEVNSGVITVTVWDKNRVDGDEISLYLNEELVLEKYTVSKTKKEIILNLKPGKNILVMHALNLGRVPPNTAALKINDGTINKNVTLISDLKNSGALELIYNP